VFFESMLRARLILNQCCSLAPRKTFFDSIGQTEKSVFDPGLSAPGMGSAIPEERSRSHDQSGYKRLSRVWREINRSP
jgi:hypothetical protein